MRRTRARSSRTSASTCSSTRSSSRARSGCAKPSAQIYLRALDELGAQPHRRVLVDDQAAVLRGRGGARDRRRPDRPRRHGRGRRRPTRDHDRAVAARISTGLLASVGAVQPRASRRRRNRPDHGVVPALDAGRRSRSAGVTRSASAYIEVDDIELVPFSSVTAADVRKSGEKDRESLRPGPRTRDRSPTTRSCTASSSTSWSRDRAQIQTARDAGCVVDRHLRRLGGQRAGLGHERARGRHAEVRAQRVGVGPVLEEHQA